MNSEISKVTKYLGNKILKFSTLILKIPGLGSFYVRTKNSLAKLLTPQLKKNCEQIAALVPGLFLIAIGISALLAPQFLRILLAGLCISFGSLVCILSHKFLILKRKLSQFSHQIEARLIIDPGKISDLQKFENFENKKEFFH